MLNWVGESRSLGSWQEEVIHTPSWAEKSSGKGGIQCNMFALVVMVIWRERNFEIL